MVRRIQSNFRFENCISANNDEEAEKNQLLLNTLEDENVEKVWMNDKLWYTRIKLDKSFYAPDNYINELEKNNTLVVELESSVLRYFNELTFYKVSPWLHDEYYFNKEYNRKIEIEW